MNPSIELTADEHVPGRSFSDPAHSPEDLQTMQHMARQLVDTYDDPVVCDFVPGKRAICMSDPQGRHFRIYYVQPGLLFQQQNITVVGFFGQKRAEASVRPLLAADKRFELTFHDHPGLLSLSTVRLPDGDFANLVLFTDPESKDRWNQSPLHRELVPKLSPAYYKSIRLNNGVLPAGLDHPEQLRLLRVKYLDYETDSPWRATRVYEGGS